MCPEKQENQCKQGIWILMRIFAKERFFRNLLLGEQWDLRNRYLHIHPTDEWRVQANLGENVAVNVAETVEKIVNILSQSPSATVRELSEILGLSRRGVEEQMKSLKQKGIIRCIGPDKGGYWEVVK